MWDCKHNPVCEDAATGFIYDTLCTAGLHIATCPKEELENDSATDDTDDDGDVDEINDDDEDADRDNRQLDADDIVRIGCWSRE